MKDNGGHVVTISIAGDTVRVEPAGRANGVFASALDLPGGYVVFDARDPAALPYAVIDHDAAARPWLVRLFGVAVADVVARCSSIDDTEESGEQAVVSTDPAPEGEILARIAFGQWLWRYWPLSPDVSPIDPQLLRIELAALAWQIEAIAGGSHLAGALLQGQLGVLRDGAAALAEGGGSRSADDALRGALDAVLVGEAGIVAGATEEELDALDEIVTRGAVLTPETSGGTDAGALASWVAERADVFARLADRGLNRASLALAASADPGSTGQIRESVDWTQVPPRVLDWADDTVAMDVEATDGRVLVTVRVAATPDDSGAVLFARIYRAVDSPGGDLPIAVMPLTRDDGGYVGSTRVAGAAEALVVDVYAAESVLRPRLTGAARRGARRERAEARDLIRSRDAGGGATGPGRRFAAEGSLS